MLRRPVLTVALLFAALTTTTEAQAQIEGLAFGPLVGVDFEAEELFIGVEGWIPLSGVELADNTVFFNPAFMWYPFIGTEQSGVDASFWGFSLDGVLPFQTDGSAEPYVKAGLGFFFFSSSSSESEFDIDDTDLTLNLGAGANFGEPDANRFYGEIDIYIGDSSSVALRGGYRFVI